VVVRGGVSAMSNRSPYTDRERNAISYLEDAVVMVEWMARCVMIAEEAAESGVENDVVVNLQGARIGHETALCGLEYAASNVVGDIRDALSRVLRERKSSDAASWAGRMPDLEMSAAEVLEGEELWDFMSLSGCSATSGDALGVPGSNLGDEGRGSELLFFPVWMRSDRRDDGLSPTLLMSVEDRIEDIEDGDGVKEGCGAT